MDRRARATRLRAGPGWPENWFMNVTAITHRRDPLYQNAFVGHSDNLLLSGLMRTSFIENAVRIACPTVRAVAVPRGKRWRTIPQTRGALLGNVAVRALSLSVGGAAFMGDQ